jgi:hypothetical protein
MPLVEMAVHELYKGGSTAHDLDQAGDIVLIISPGLAGRRGQRQDWDIK